MAFGDTLTIGGVPILFNYNHLNKKNLQWRAVAHGYLGLHAAVVPWTTRSLSNYSGRPLSDIEAHWAKPQRQPRPLSPDTFR